ncbi:MAG: helix-turn-helix domain-containing protein, partial [Pseudonocardiaceae bacterium]
MDAEEARTIGRRLRMIRKSRRKSLVVIAGLAGMSKSQLDRIERGEVALDKLSEIVPLANALQVAPSELMRLPVPAPGNGGTDSAVIAVRHALVAVELGSPGGQLVPIEHLRGRVFRLLEARRRCRFREVGGALPGLIRDLHTSIASGRDLGELLPLAVILHVHVTRMWLDDAGATVDLRRQVALVARGLAQQHGEVATLGVAAFGTVYALLAEGMLDLAQGELDAVTLPATTAETVGLAGGLMMTRSLVAAVAKRPGDVEASMESAAELAARFGELGESDPLGFGFGPTNVGMRRMELALESGEPERAISIARTIQ